MTNSNAVSRNSAALDLLRLEQERRRRERISVDLLDFVPRVTPRWQRPTHLRRIAEAVHEAETRPIRLLVSVPPRHGKTELILHTIAWWLIRHPEQTIVYASYSADIARSKSRLARDYARRAGVKLRDDSTALNEWRTPEGGGLIATGVGGPLTGHGAHLLIVDDPHKNRAEAESQTIRDTIHEWFTSTAMSRIEPGGSVIVVHTRWHPDDLIGRLENDAETRWDYINLPALDPETGDALWPDRWPVEAIVRRKAEVGEYDAASLYDGNPRPRGGQVFAEPTYYDELPSGGYRVGIGLDLAYSAKTKSDYSVIVVGQMHGDTFYVTNVVREQKSADAFAPVLNETCGSHKGVQPRWYCSGTEKGVADLLGKLGTMIDARTTNADKFVRAQPVAARWNMGKVLVKRNAPWTSAFVAEVTKFTGVNDPHDDQVDALAAAFDSVGSTAPQAASVFYPIESAILDD
jgi:predicted phage terminase large subunit-like protein